MRFCLSLRRVPHRVSSLATPCYATPRIFPRIVAILRWQPNAQPPNVLLRSALHRWLRSASRVAALHASPFAAPLAARFGSSRPDAFPCLAPPRTAGFAPHYALRRPSQRPSSRRWQCSASPGFPPLYEPSLADLRFSPSRFPPLRWPSVASQRNAGRFSAPFYIASLVARRKVRDRL
jgi:hypothetical protein